MSEVLDKARLVSELDGPGVTATVARSEIEEALRSAGESVELMLDVARRNGADVEAHALRFMWETNELGELLRRAEDDNNVTLVFDEAELEQALEQADVEAHGMRDKALVLAVAIAAAGGGAAKVAAAPPAVADGGGAGGPAKVTAVAPPVGPKHQAEGTGFVATSAVDTARTAPPVGPKHQAEGTGFVATSAVDTARTAPPVGPKHQAEGTGFVATASVDATTTDTGSGVGGTDTTTGLIAGGTALLITAVGFAARGQRKHTPRPA